MISLSESPWVLGLALRLAWRGDRRIAQKLHGFSATELGSALDMFRAAELATDADHRRLFFRHALDESRHAARFRAMAEQVRPGSRARPLESRHALPQDLYRHLGTERFLAFVHLSEARAARHFEALARHFAGLLGESRHAAALHGLFSELSREEKVHVAYSRHLLERCFPEAERARGTRRALARERRALAWAAWKRAGSRLGDRAVTLLMAVTFALVLPLFAPLARLAGHSRPGWHPSPVDRAAAARPVLVPAPEHEPAQVPVPVSAQPRRAA